MDIIELKKIVKENGVAGAGGAGFPTYAKLDEKIDTIILNCAECEPLLKVHRQLLQKYVYEILNTLNIISESLDVKNIIIAVKSVYIKTVEAVTANIDSFENMKLKLLPEIYPSGDEVILIYETTKKVVPAGSIPIEVGVAVLNVETVFNIYNALNNKPVIYKYLTIAGEVNNAITVKAPIGISVEELVKFAGGATIEDPIFIMGGPMTGHIVKSYDTINKTSNAILVMPKTHNIVNKRLGSTSTNMKRAMSTCCQCQMCTDLCPRNLLGHPIKPHLFMRAATSGNTSDINSFLMTMFCSGCGLCEMYSCNQGLSPRSLISEYKDGLKKNGVAIPKNMPLAEVNTMIENRRIPMERLTWHIGLGEYDILAPLKDEVVKTNIVKIQLNQNIGIPPIPIVNKNDIIYKNQLIAQAVEHKLSLPIHSPISGVILDINNKYITIKAGCDIHG